MISTTPSASTKGAQDEKRTKPPSPMSRLKPFLGKRKAALSGAVGAAVLATLLGLVPYWVVYRICAGLLDGSLLADQKQLLLYAVIAMLSIGLKGILTAVSIDWTHKVAYDVVYDIRMALADKLVRLPLGYFDRTDSGKIKHTLNEDVEQLEEGIAHLLPDISTSTALPILSFLLMFSLDWRMGLAVLGFIGLTVVGYRIVLKILKPIQAGYGKAGPAISGAILTYVYGMKVIRAFSRTDHAFEAYAKAVRAYSEAISSIERRSMPAKTAAVLLSRTALLIVVPVGLWLIAKGEATVPVLIFFVLMSMGVGAALFKMLRSSGMTAFRLSASLKNVSRMLEEAEIPSAERPLLPDDTTIRYRHVTFAYNRQNVLEDVSLDIPPGTMTALVGPSGAGKTTMARLLPRFWDVSGGSISIGGADVRDIPEDKLMALVSFVFQDAYLFRGTVMDNIRLGKPDATDEEVRAAARKAACDAFIRELPDGYETIVGEGGVTLSGGQRQRISLVRAVLKDAPIIMLDEATALVDPENEARIRDALTALLQPGPGKPKTIVAIAHRLGTIVHADQIVVMDEGKIVHTGKHDELLRESELYRRAWEAYQAGADDLDNLEAADAEREEGKTETSGDEAEPNGGEVQTDAVVASRGFSDDNSSGTVDPHRHLLDMSAHKQTMLLAGEKSRTVRWIYAFSILENGFVALGSLAIVAVLYALLVGDYDAAWRRAAWMGLLFVGQAVFYYLTNRWSFPLFGHFLTHMRLYLGDRLRRLPFGFFVERDASLLESRIKADAGTYIYIPTVVIVLMKAAVIPPILLAVMIGVDWRLAIASLIGVPLSVLTAWLAERKLQEVLHRLSLAREDANSRILEYIRGITVIRSFGMTGSRMHSYEEAIRRYRDASIAINRKLTPYTSIYSISFELGFSLVLIVGGYLTGAGTLAPAVFMAFLVLAICFYEPLPLMDYALYRRMYMTNVRHMNDIIQADDLPAASGTRKPDDYEIAFRNVSFGYKENDVVRGLNLSIPAKGTTALVGPSGGGKTTILHLIARFWDVRAGAITIGGTDVRSMDSDELMKLLAFVFQDVYLFDDTVANNIRYGKPDATLEEVMEAARKARCHDFILKLSDGYDSVVGEGGGLLSGGQRQRISIARAMLKDAPIVLLDEATASVDPDNERYIQEAFEELAKDRTVVIIAHRLNTVRRADRIVVIDQGGVAQLGTHKELIGQSGIYRRFWEERRRVRNWEFRAEAERQER
ncbi:ABC transporter ATP-binding protein [Paenibacillus hemerocallicola]|uniref:ABC transporter ATP-binding protein n=1 Tax=Paenibacillus hemerocallicola TaxID=1172614 RepID=UPI001C4035D2|nr:ABC transporter ATP-binding protein [Paenibacillus hemerocallicola]